MADRDRRPSTPMVVGLLVLLAALYGGFALAGEGFGKSDSPVISGVMAVALLALLGWFLLRRRNA